MIISGTASRTRFSLVLLSEDEHFLEDHAATYAPPQPGSPFRLDRAARALRLRGRLFVCSQSLLFEPQDLDRPLFKFPFKLVSDVTGSQRAFFSPFFAGKQLSDSVT